MPKILIVDDETGMRKSLSILLRREGYDTAEARSGPEALQQVEDDPPDVVITDVRMNVMSGIDLLRELKERQPECEVILMTAYGTVEAAVEAMKLGAFDFVTKPFQNEEIVIRVRNALDKGALRRRLRNLRREIRSLKGFTAILGTSPAITAAVELIPRLAASDSTVLLTGESGTGKELFARAIHDASARREAQFISINCAAFPEQLLEGELFGHVRGAFTGATTSRKGLLEEAQGGTFLLDEIGEASVAIQAKLLRVIEEKRIRRVGDNRQISVDVRIIAATNRDLTSALAEKSFREDLYYRLNVLHLHLPSLRERREDIPLLTQHFLARCAERSGREITGFTDETMAVLLRYDYPGNVRELHNIVEQAVALSTGAVITAENLPPKLSGTSRGMAVAPESVPAVSLSEMERNLIITSIRERKGNLTLVAKDLGISRTTLWRRMREHGIKEIRGEKA